MRDKQAWSDYPPVRVLREIGKRWPSAWTQVRTFRAGRGHDLPTWPEWCYLPIAAGVAIATQGNDAMLYQATLDPYLPPSVIAAAAAWRVGKSIYRYDPDLYRELIAQPMDGNLPCEILHRLPDYCVYIETPGIRALDGDVSGVWAHLEHDAHDGREELRLVLLMADGTNRPMPIHLGDWTLDEGLQRMHAEAERQAGGPLDAMNITADLMPILQLVLYLCADNAELPDGARASLPRRDSNHVPDLPRRWDVGVRIGAALRRYRATESESDITTSDGHAPPRPHMRRAHWHHFWTGPRAGDRRLILHWLPPIPVGVDQEDGPAVIHPVK